MFAHNSVWRSFKVLAAAHEEIFDQRAPTGQIPMVLIGFPCGEPDAEIAVQQGLCLSFQRLEILYYLFLTLLQS